MTSGGQTSRESTCSTLAAQNGIPIVARSDGARSSSRRSARRRARPALRHAERQSEHDELTCGRARATSTRSSRSVKIDYNLTPKHRLSGTYNWQVVVRDPDQLNGDDVRFPGLAQLQPVQSVSRPLASGALRSTLVAEHGQRDARRRPLGARILRRPRQQRSADVRRPGGYALDASATSAPLTNWHVADHAELARAPCSWNIDDTLTWQRGQHSLSFGGVDLLRPRLGREPADGADDQLRRRTTRIRRRRCSRRRTSRARRPGSSATPRRCSRCSPGASQHRRHGRARRGHEPVRLSRQRASRPASMNEYSLFIQDSWRVTPTLTINGGAALGRADAVPADQRHHVARRPTPTPAASRASAPTA